MRPIPDEKVKPGMIVMLKDAPGEKYEVLETFGGGKEKALLRRYDLERPVTPQEK